MSCQHLGLLLAVVLAAGCSETYLFQRTDLAVAPADPSDSRRALRESDGSVRLIPYDNLRLGKDSVAMLAQSPQPLARLPVRSRGYFHQLAGGIVLASLAPIGLMLGVSLNSQNDLSSPLGPVMLMIMGGASVIAGPALLIRGAVIDYKQVREQ